MSITIRKRLGRVISIAAAGALVAAAASPALAHEHKNNHSSTPFISKFSTVTNGAASAPAAGPEAGDQNPYGVAVVPRTVGNLVKGNILVSNFNNAGAPPTGNLQGTGSSIVQYAPDVQSQTTFTELSAAALPGGPSSCPGGVGLTTALVVLRSGWVIVGSLPTTDGSIGTVGAGCLIVLDAKGNPVETFSGGAINGPWDMTARDGGFIAQLFFSNVLNGSVAAAAPDTPVNAGTVVRMTLFTPPQGFGKPIVLETTVIGSGFPEENDPAALIIGPTGVGFSRGGENNQGNDNNQGDEGSGDTLYVADTVGNRIAKIPHASFRHSSAGIGATVASGLPLNGPLGLAIAPNGDILTVNSVDGNIVDTAPAGTPQTSATIAPAGAGSLFGLAVMPGGAGIYFVDDSENQLNLFH
jgi:hypothetical protein